MLTDVFLRRYQNVMLWSSYDQRDSVFWFQIASLIVKELLPPGVRENNSAMEDIVRRVTMEIGGDHLPFDQTYSYGFGSSSHHHESVWTFLRMVPGRFDPPIDEFTKYKISLVELVFRIAAEKAKLADELDNPPQRKRLRFLPRKTSVRQKADSYVRVFDSKINELNQRFEQAKYPLSYNNGYIQIRESGVIATNIADPFWQLVEDENWQNVSIDMAEALDLRDNGGMNPSLYAAKALESAIKIISDNKGWTRGTEKGASAYIDNLVSQSNGRFIEPWEAEALKFFFAKIRNPLGHGVGSGSMPILTMNQDNWAIEACMSWVKSLIVRI